jgi:hypothetical protein
MRMLLLLKYPMILAASIVISLDFLSFPRSLAATSERRDTEKRSHMHMHLYKDTANQPVISEAIKEK